MLERPSAAPLPRVIYLSLEANGAPRRRSGGGCRWNRYFFRPDGTDPAVGGYEPTPPLARGAANDHLDARSHMAGVAAVVLLFVGLLFASYSVLVPGLLGLLMLSAFVGFVSARVNPFSLGYYLPTKPTWTAIAVVGLVGLLLLSLAWSGWRSGADPLLPKHWP